MQKYIEKVKTLLEALPYIKRFNKKTIVIKYGGNAMVDDELKKSFAMDISLMKYIGLNPVIVHGGGPQIGALLRRLGKSSKFVDGIRVTDEETMDVVEMVLAGKINKEIVALINHFGGRAVGISGKDGGLIMARKIEDAGDSMGMAGDVAEVNPDLVLDLEKGNFIPVIAPVGTDGEGTTFNINADIVAGKIAESLGAAKLILLTDIDGVMGRDRDLIRGMGIDLAEGLIRDGIASGGMIPKLRCCLDAIKGGVGKSHIINGTIEHAVLLEVFTDAGIGTEIYRSGDDEGNPLA